VACCAPPGAGPVAGEAWAEALGCGVRLFGEPGGHLASPARVMGRKDRSHADRLGQDNARSRETRRIHACDLSNAEIAQAVMFCEVVEILDVEGGQREVVG
jgi:hypothetical protein